MMRVIGKIGWAILHFPAVLRRCIIAVHIAEDLQATVQARQSELDAFRNVDDKMLTKVAALASAQAANQATLATLTATLAAMPTAGLDSLRPINDDVDRLTKQIAMVRREILFQQRRLTRFASGGTGEQDPIKPRLVAEGRHDSLYAAFEDAFRGTREDIKQRLGMYIPYLTLSGAGEAGIPIVDIGCGRGEWLELLRDQGLVAYGIDSNAVMVERSASLRLNAQREDLLTHLNGLEDCSRSAVTAFHVVEHLPFDVLVDFLDEALRVLIPGGILILETPNPETVRVGATTFYYDPTHRNPLIPASLQFILEHRGFTEVEILRLHPFTQGLLEEDTEDARLLNRVLFGPQDYALIARRG